MKTFNYLALGDSYTVGEDVEKSASFPFQLFHSVEDQGMIPDILSIIAVTGWTTSDLLEALRTSDVLRTRWDVVTLLVGVNNQYQKKKISLYEKEFQLLLNKAIALTGGKSDKVIVVSIPDYGVTRFAQKMNSKQISMEIAMYNTIAEQYARKHYCNFVNITDLSKYALEDTTLIANDGLHPSGKQYRLWVKRILPVFTKVLTNG